jgi:hypothetical protein
MKKCEWVLKLFCVIKTWIKHVFSFPIKSTLIQCLTGILSSSSKTHFLEKHIFFSVGYLESKLQAGERLQK